VKVAPQQLEELFRDYGSKIYGLALRTGLAPKDAEDGVQEVFLKVQRRISTFRGEAALSTWLYQVALNTLRDHRRKVVRQTRAVNMSVVSDQSADPTFENQGDAPEVAASRSERRQLVRDALDRLPAKFREVLILRELQGLAYRDIARILEVKQGTVESRIFRARERLAKELKRMGVEG
jgi:RNA polymerase sigma-70 factor (ECF subfamily)